MLLMIDNYDSFTWNLVQYLGELGCEVKVLRNDERTVEEAVALRPSHVVISPGPCAPNEAGISLALSGRLAGSVPLLGVCLGHQSIGRAFGGEVVRARQVMHGKVSQVRHDGRGCSRGCPRPLPRPATTRSRWRANRCPRRWRSRQNRRMARSWGCAIAACRWKGRSFTPRRC